MTKVSSDRSSFTHIVSAAGEDVPVPADQSMDASPPPMAEDTPASARDWSLLPFDALALVFVKLGALHVLMGAAFVCHSWLQAAKLPDIWRVVDMDNLEGVRKPWRFLRWRVEMAKAAIDRSDGQLRVFAGTTFVTDDLLQYIVERSPSLSTLRLLSCREVFSKRLANVTKEYPLLELLSLEIDDSELTVGELTAVLENCPVMEVLLVHDFFELNIDDERALREKFARIKSITLEYDAELLYDSDFGWDDYDFDYAPSFEDERTDDGSL